MSFEVKVIQLRWTKTIFVSFGLLNRFVIYKRDFIHQSREDIPNYHSGF